MRCRALLLLLMVEVGFSGSPQESCSSLPLLKAAWHHLPADRRFPCDAKHLNVIRDFTSFLNSHPEIAANESLAQRGRHAFAFSISGNWPIYINLDGHGALPDLFDRGGYWVAYAVAGVLAHERVHAMGNPAESAGLLEELRIDEDFQQKGQLPTGVFDLKQLRQQYWNALAEERRLHTAAR